MAFTFQVRSLSIIVVVTFTTIGFGDIVPVTMAGKALLPFLSTLGILLSAGQIFALRNVALVSPSLSNMKEIVTIKLAHQLSRKFGIDDDDIDLRQILNQHSPTESSEDDTFRSINALDLANNSRASSSTESSPLLIAPTLPNDLSGESSYSTIISKRSMRQMRISRSETLPDFHILTNSSRTRTNQRNLVMLVTREAFKLQIYYAIVAVFLNMVFVVGISFVDHIRQFVCVP